MRSTFDPFEVVTKVVARVEPFTEATLVGNLASALELGNNPAATAYGIHIGNLNAALSDPAYRNALAGATYLYADGTSVRVISKVLGVALPERLVTTDIVWPILRAAARGGHPVFFL